MEGKIDFIEPGFDASSQEILLKILFGSHVLLDTTSNFIIRY